MIKSEKKMNVLIITVVGGFLPKFLMQDVQMLKDRGHEVHYASNFKNPIYECDVTELEANNIHCHSISIAKNPVNIKSGITAYKQIKKIIIDNSIDAVYLHNPMGGVLGRLQTFNKKGLYVIYVGHGFHFYKGAPIINWLLFYPVEKLLAKRTDQIITINKEDMKAASSFKLRDDGFVSLIPGVGLDEFRFSFRPENKGLLRKQYGYRDDDFIFLSVGELNDNKNHQVIIEAISNIKEAHVKLMICGEGENHEKLQILIDSLGLQEKVKLWGYQTKIEDFYHMADCFMFPSKREGLGMASIEAMACGLPLIVSDNRGTKEYSMSTNSIVCKYNDVKGFEKAMQTVISDSERRKKMGISSIDIAKRFYKSETRKVMETVFDRMTKKAINIE